MELYDKFFRNAFPKMTERLGIVYTPVEVVDFIIHSVNDILQDEFGQTLGSEGVHILDPFVGTGTFITRLMQSGLITPEQLPHKYKHEIHCNEIVLLAYYIAAINIEAVYHSIMSDQAKAVGGEAPDYEPFEGILLTDTFQMYESDDLIEQFFPDNSERRKRQKKLDIRVIVGNPPYSAGQGSANDNNQNVGYSALDERIKSTYVEYSTATLRTALYDSYIRAIRWASDRVGKSGVIAFVTNAGFLEGTTACGIRKCLADEFDRIYVLHLRGNQRTSGERSRQEGGKIFGSGSRAPIAITLLVKGGRRPVEEGLADIRWHSVADYLSRDQKLEIVRNFGSISEITASDSWENIKPDEHHDWIGQRDETFGQFISIGGDGNRVFDVYSTGMKTNRDAWVYNYSRECLAGNVKLTLAAISKEASEWKSNAENVPTDDPSLISWSSSLTPKVRGGRVSSFNDDCIVRCVYRPFSGQFLYFDPLLVDRPGKMASLFPRDSSNRVICVPGIGETKGFSALICDRIPNLHFIAGSQCFPLMVPKDDATDEEGGLFSEPSSPIGRSAISDYAFGEFTAAYENSGGSLTKEDLFYYIYGLLHSPEYRERYKDNLSKELPRIPAVKKFEDFQAYSQAGRDLAHWHLDYETIDCHSVTLDFTGGPQSLSACRDEHFYVRKMKFPNVKDPETKKSVKDKTTIIYNDYITIRDIPLEAYDYVVNGKPAIEWVMERQAVTTDKKSGIVNDANLWATETMSDPAYPLELLMRIVTVSLETKKIVEGLPGLEIE